LRWLLLCWAVDGTKLYAIYDGHSEAVIGELRLHHPHASANSTEHIPRAMRTSVPTPQLAAFPNRPREARCRFVKEAWLFHIAVLVTTGTEEWQLCAGGCWCALTTHHYSHISPTLLRASSCRAAFVALANVKNQRTQTKPWSSFSIQDMAKRQLLLLCCLCFAQLHSAPKQLETGWSDGKVPAAATSWTVKRNRCQPGTFIKSWIVGEGDVLGSYGGVCYMDIFAKQQWHCPPGSSRLNLISCDPPRWFAPPTPG
jgi:hypothetical protein